MKKEKGKTMQVHEEPSIHAFLYSFSHTFYSKTVKCFKCQTSLILGHSLGYLR